jgi:signal transduction histidine kinase
MPLAQQFVRHSTGRDTLWWPVLLLLLVVLVPAAGVVWMMRAAIENERLAVRQRLAEVYRTQLQFAQHRIETEWRQKIDTLALLVKEHAPAKAFAECIKIHGVSSVIILDEAGQVAYPSPLRVAESAPQHPRFDEAQRLEFADNAVPAAIQLYREIADMSDDRQIVARARQALARCLLRSNDREGAVAALKLVRADESATDPQGRSLAADAELRLLEVLDPTLPERADVAAALVARLNNYDSPLPPADQRRFLMHEVLALLPAVEFPTLAAEDLAARYVSMHLESSANELQTQSLRGTSILGVWQAVAPGGRLISLHGAEKLRDQFQEGIDEQGFPLTVQIAIHEPAEQRSDDEFQSISLGPMLRGWRLSLEVGDKQSLDTATDDRMTFYLWTAVAVIVLTAALAMLMAGVVGRQLRLTRLKNDLVATVSHELKTPLASIRLLVDTMLESDSADAAFAGNGRTREYLQLISQENTRLSRLIDNFLTFSRMERGKHRFDFQPADAAQIVRRAVEAVADRFAAPHAELHVDVKEPLPILGDADALVTVVVNLLDNAYKYTGDMKRVEVSAQKRDESVSIVVEDNGIGLSPRAARRVWDRFFQVDQRLSRTQGGCGLGLAIVRYIVEAHGGRVSVESRPGLGSKFTVTLPLDLSFNPLPQARLTSTSTSPSATG